MKTFLIKILTVLLAAVLLCSFTACGKKKETGDETKFTNYDFVADGKSDYKIVYPAGTAFDGPLYRGVRDLKKYIEEATGVSLEITEDSDLSYFCRSLLSILGRYRFA